MAIHDFKGMDPSSVINFHWVLQGHKIYKEIQKANHRFIEPATSQTAANLFPTSMLTGASSGLLMLLPIPQAALFLKLHANTI